MSSPSRPLPPHAGQPVASWGAPLAEARAVVIMVHGRGASARSILELAPAIASPGVAFLAPGAVGGTWYPMSFMAPTAQNEPGITSGISVVHGLIDEVIAQGIPAERIVLLGFSQGACLASTAAQRRPQRYGGVVVLSGGLIGPPGTTWSEEGDFAGTPVFLGCSDVDAHIPEARVRESAAVFERMKADVDCRIYAGMGHLVNEDEIRWTRDLLAEISTPL
jgi:phospholipase/carboxylesterase